MTAARASELREEHLRARRARVDRMFAVLLAIQYVAVPTLLIHASPSETSNVITNFDWYHPLHAHRHTPEELRAWCAARLATFKVPKEIAFTVALPRTPSGKVARKDLR